MIRSLFRPLTKSHASQRIGIARVLRIYSLLLGICGALQLFFAIFAFSPLQTFEKAICYILGGIFVGIGIALMLLSLLAKMQEYRLLDIFFREYVPEHFGKIILTDFSKQNHIPREIAQEFIDYKAKRQFCVVQELYGGEKIYVFLDYSPN